MKFLPPRLGSDDTSFMRNQYWRCKKCFFVLNRNSVVVFALSVLMTMTTMTTRMMKAMSTMMSMVTMMTVSTMVTL